MRYPTHTLLIAATVATTLATGQPGLALTADEKRENSRLADAKRATITRKMADVRFNYAEECEAAFAAGQPMPKKDVRVTDPEGIDKDLMGMSVEQISEQFGIASEQFRKSDRAVNDCVRKYRKKGNDGS